MEIGSMIAPSHGRVFKSFLDAYLPDWREREKGITYRQGVKEFYQSRNMAISKKLLEKGLTAYALDELMSKEEV